MKQIRCVAYLCDTCGHKSFTTRGIHIHAHHRHGDPAAADVLEEEKKFALAFQGREVKRVG